MATTWTTGDVSGSETLTDNDHLYPGHVNELRDAINAVEDTLGSITEVLDEDDMSSNSATALATQQSIKAYADTKAPKADPTFTGTVSVAGAITQAGAADHITITPGTSKLVKTAVLRQDITTNSYSNNQVILTGWGYITGNGAATRLNESVTFGVTFASAPIVLISMAGNLVGSNPSAVSDLVNTTDDDLEWRAYASSTTGFTAEVESDVNLGSTSRYGYSWIAIGTLS